MEDNWHLQSCEEALSSLDSTREGLSSKEAAKRAVIFGANRLANCKDPSLWTLFFRQFYSPFILILALAAGAKFFLANEMDGVVLLATIFLMAFIGFFQEMKAEKSLRALKKLSAHKSKFMRDGKLQIGFSELLVPGDIIVLEVGDTIPADARLIEAMNFKVQESSLTGESVPVEKNTKELKEATVLADRTNMVYTGTVVVCGRGIAVVAKIGQETCLGQIATSIQKIEQETTPLQKDVQAIGRWMLGVIFCVVAGFIAIGLYRGIAIMDVLLLAIAVIVSAIPEGLPIAFTAIFAAGMYTMAKKNAIIRRLNAVETLGSTTVICTDKTGTLTLNQMTVSQLYCFDQQDVVKEKMLQIGILCNDARIRLEKGVYEMIGDPTEGALLVAADQAGIDHDALLQQFPRIGELPFFSENLYMATSHLRGKKLLICVKGAPEKLLLLSRFVFTKEGVVPLTEEMRGAIEFKIREMTENALRLLAVGFVELSANEENLEESSFREKLIFTGIFGIIDPPRKEVVSAIHACYSAGIRVIMITGDNPATAMAIAEELNISSEGVIVGKDLETMGDEELKEKMQRVSIFARVEPNHKLRIVRNFQAMGQIVAMTGDGVNDAPALEAANIGISMGKGGTDVAKEASDMILADDRFDSIVAAIEEGRAIFNRLRNVCAFLITTCFGELFGLILSVFFTGLSPLLALQILWVNLVSGSVIAIPLGFEPKVGHEMKHPPRKPFTKLVHQEMVYRIVFLASLLGLGSFCIFKFTYLHIPLEKARTMVLCSIVVFEWLIGFEMRSAEVPSRKLGFFKNKSLLLSIGLMCLLHFSILYVPAFRLLFHTEPLSLREWGIACIPGVFIFILESIRKEFFIRPCR